LTATASWATLLSVPPQTHYAKSGDVHIAYQVSGKGPPDVVIVHGFVSNVELMWEMPFTGPALRRAEQFARVVCFDKRGTGLSDRSVGVPTLEERMDDVRAVMDAANVERASLWGISEGGPMCLLFAATYPERTSSLVLQGSFARLSQAPDQPFGYPLEAVAPIVATFEEEWGTGAVLQNFFPSSAEDPEMRGVFARYERNSASPGAMVDIVKMLANIDVRSVLPTISAPVLVLHGARDSVVTVEHGRYLADHIEGARYIELTGDDHLPIHDEEQRHFDDIEEFLTGHRPDPISERVLKTVLFTDIVDSTATAGHFGDKDWRALLDRHDSIIRTEIDRFRGVEVNTTGDGFLAAFDGPARAVQCAMAAREGVGSVGLRIRAGVHTGECVERGGDLAGIAVHIAARVLASAKPGEVLVSRTVTDLVAGSGLSFIDRGEHELKGVPGDWQLFAVQG
jgi:class 3 adenylate cyclase